MANIKEITAYSHEHRLTGSLYQPVEPRALLLMHPGSGPSDRHNDNFFPPIRQSLLDRSIAVASFDKRGVGGSEGDWRGAGISAQGDDLCAGLDAVRKFLPDVRTGIFGHSQGGWVVMECAERSGADFAITSSGPAVSPNQQELFATRNALTKHLVDEKQISDSVRVFAKILAHLSNGESFAFFENWAAAHPESMTILRDAGAFVPENQAHWDLAASMVDYDPVSDLRSLRIPLLAVFGSDDSGVPVEESIRVLRQTVPTPLLHTTLVVGGNHRMQLEGSVNVAPRYLEELSAFIERQ